MRARLSIEEEEEGEEKKEGAILANQKYHGNDYERPQWHL